MTANLKPGWSTEFFCVLKKPMKFKPKGYFSTNEKLDLFLSDIFISGLEIFKNWRVNKNIVAYKKLLLKLKVNVAMWDWRNDPLKKQIYLWSWEKTRADSASNF